MNRYWAEIKGWKTFLIHDLVNVYWEGKVNPEEYCAVCCEAQCVADSWNGEEAMENIRIHRWRWLLQELYCIHRETQRKMFLCEMS